MTRRANPRPAKKIFHKIGEVCELTKTEPYVLRYWESEFPFLAPEKNRAGQRIYSDDDIQMVLAIKRLLYEEGYTTAGARRRLEKELSDRQQGGAAESDEAANPGADPSVTASASTDVGVPPAARATRRAAGATAGHAADATEHDAELRATVKRVRDELRAIREQLAGPAARAASRRGR